MSAFVQLGEVIGSVSAQRAGNDELPILSMTMHEGLVDQSAKFKKRVASEDTSQYKIVERGQLVVGFPIDEGVLSFQRKYNRAIVSPAYGIWSIIKNDVEPSYLESFLRSPTALHYYASRLRSTTARRRSLPQDIFLELPVLLPPLDEQRRIAAILDKADALRRKRKRALELLDRLTQSIFLEMFGDPVSNEKSLPTTTLGSLGVEMAYGPRFHNETYSEDGTRIVRITDLNQSGELNFDDMPLLSVSSDDLETHRSRPGQILFARTGATVGKMALVMPHDPVTIPGAYFIRLSFPKQFDPLFAWNTLRQPSIQRIIAEQSRQSAQQNFSGPGLRRLPFFTPSIVDQARFSDRAASVMNKKASYRAHMLELESTFLSLQDRAFAGLL